MRRPSHRALVVSVVALLGASACDVDPEPVAPAPFVEALPDLPLLELAFPDTLGVVPIAGPVPVEAAPLVGEPSALHAVARDTAGQVNRALRAMLQPVSRVREGLTPVRAGPDRVVWEGTFGDEPDRHRLVVSRVDEGRFEFTLASQDRAAAAAPWRLRVGGSTTPSQGARGRGRGVVWVDLDADRHPETQGRVVALWQHLDARREVDVSFLRSTPDGATLAPRTLRFLYTQGPLAGRMAFGPQAINVHERPDRPALEDVTILSRWNARGAGRTDVTARGGDLRLDGIAASVRSECWGPPPDFPVDFAATFARRLDQADLSRVTHAGDPAACGFPEPELASVPPVEPDPIGAAR